ncbi:MAG: O-antigen ligase family protein [Pseudomonadaceae bacterium]|nr:O-antigen ligase family protein [Pseudomonadaceae bacterium]
MIFVTSLLLGLIYLNVPAVAVREFGVPFAVGALIPMLLVVPVLHRVLIKGEPLRFPLFLVLALVLLVLHAFSALGSIRPHESLEIVIDWALEGVLLAALLVNVLRSRNDVIAAVKALVLAGFVMGTVVIIQQLAGATDNNYMGFGQLDSAMVSDSGQLQTRLAGPIGETNRFAQIMAVLIPLAAALAFTSAGAMRWFYWLATLVISGGMALAFSRGAVVALALAAPFALAFRFIALRHVVLGVFGAVVLLALLPHYAERVVSIGQVAVQSLGLSPGGLRNADGAARGRMTEMMAAGLVFVDHPVLGAGPGMAQVHYPKYAAKVGGKVRPGTRRSHNLFLQLAAETGVLGLAAFFAVLGVVVVGLERARRRHFKRDREMWAIVCGLELALIISLTTSLFLHAAYVRYFWLLLGLCVAASAVTSIPVLVRLLSRMLGETMVRLRPQT